MAGHARSARGAGSETTGYGLEAGARKQFEQVFITRERDGGELAPVYCWGRVPGLNSSDGRLRYLSQNST